MVTLRYDDGTETPAELKPVDQEFEYVPRGDYWLIKVGVVDGKNIMKIIPNHRIFDIDGLSAEIRHPRP